ncbi:MAG TPA: hypothetical protein VJS64_12875 [Pyrinomonadaceae bacterium]|nr:hypothetical protein [Pyrinomonadaceae bacterium]
MNRDIETVHEQAKAVSDAAIRRSLLGCAAPFEQAKFETLLMLDEQFEKRVYRLELELTDDFSFGSLSRAEHQLFRTRFMVTRTRWRGLAVSQALLESTSMWASESKKVNRRWAQSFLHLFSPDHPLAGHALAATVLLFFGFLFWLSLSVPSRRVPRISPRQQPAATQEKQYAHPPSERRSTAANLVLQPDGGSPDGGSANRQTIHISDQEGSGENVSLEMLVDKGQELTYQASLMTEAGEQVTAFSELRGAASDPAKVVVNVPAQLLKDGTYYINLMWTSDNISQSVRYTFQVKHE